MVANSDQSVCARRQRTADEPLSYLREFTDNRHRVALVLCAVLMALPALARAATYVLPSWVPGPGFAARVPTHNTLTSQDPANGVSDPWWVKQWGGKRNNQILNAWGSSAYAADLGRYGSIVYNGGGHGDYGGNEVYALNLENLEYRRLVSVLPANAADIRDDYTHCEYAPGVPMSSHDYDGLVVVPGMLIGGGLGMLLRPQSMACGHLARDSGWAHAFDFSTLEWSRWSINAYGNNKGIGPIFGTALDPKRRRVWEIAMSSTSSVTRIGWLDLETKKHFWVAVQRSPVVEVDTLCLEYVPGSDIVVAGFMDGAHALRTTIAYFVPGDPAYGLREARLSKNILAGGPALAYGGRGRLYVYVKSDPQTLYELQVPKDLDSTWNVVPRTIAGYDMRRLSFGSGGMYKKMVYATKIQSLIFSAASSDSGASASAVIAFRPPDY